MDSSFSTPRVLYEHRQAGWTMLALACIPGLCVFVNLMMSAPAARTLPVPLIIGLVIVTAFLLLSFTSLSIVVTRDYVVARFGIGIVRKTVALADIVNVEVTRTRWYEGWGIHWSPRGMIYNVAGFDAVAIHLAGGKSVVIGTDDAPRLVAAIRRAIDDRQRPSGTTH
jgi:hypothetical protein